MTRNRSFVLNYENAQRPSRPIPITISGSPPATETVRAIGGWILRKRVRLTSISGSQPTQQTWADPESVASFTRICALSGPGDIARSQRRLGRDEVRRL